MRLSWVVWVRKLSCVCVVGFEGPIGGMGLAVVECL